MNRSSANAQVLNDVSSERINRPGSSTPRLVHRRSPAAAAVTTPAAVPAVGCRTANPTIKDIAALVGQSYATVSRALNDKYGVKPETRRRVLAAAAELQYRPNALARGLITKKSSTIGLIIPDLRNPFFPEIAAGIEAAADQLGYSVLIGSTDYHEQREDHYFRLLSERRVDGLIVAPVSRSAGRYPQAIPDHLPLVFVSSVPEGIDTNYVVIDNRAGGFVATQHLIDRGYVPPAFLGAINGADTGRRRREGYQDALHAAAIAFDPRRVFLGAFTREAAGGLIIEAHATDRMPRSIFCENDDLGITVVQVLLSLGYRIPEDVAVIGFDDIAWAGLHAVELTTVAQPIHEMGRRALEMMIAAIDSGADQPPVILEPRLVVRKTT